MRPAEAPDILVDIGDDDLEELAELYRNHLDWAPHVYSFVKLGIRWKKSREHRHLLTFMSPNNSWRIDGTIIVLQQFCYDLFVFTLDKGCRNLYNGLTKTTRLDFGRKIMFFSVHTNHIPTILEVIKEKNLSLGENAPSISFTFPLEQIEHISIDCPSDVYVKKLETSAAAQINAVWPHRYPNSEKYISTLIEMNGGCGVFLKNTNELVAWVLMTVWGHLGVLQTAEDHKKKGYGSLVTKSMIRMMAEEGVASFAAVLMDNQASLDLFRKLGFREIGSIMYMVVQKD